jgi:hypothetical protein
VGRFAGAPHIEDGWRRVEKSLLGKARQTAGGTGIWIRFDAVDGLFSLTDWAQWPFPRRAHAIASAIRGSLTGANHLAGVVLSSGASMNFDSPNDPALTMTATAEGATLMRRPIAPGLHRETAVVPLRTAAAGTACWWVSAYDGEPGWLPRDLAEAGLPTLNQMWRSEAD